jgi:hypothetical protein
MTAERTVLDLLDDGVVAVAVVKRAHDLERRFTAVRAGGLVHDEVTGVALVSPLACGDFVEALIFFCQFLLLAAPVHDTSICGRIYNPSDAG